MTPQATLVLLAASALSIPAGLLAQATGPAHLGGGTAQARDILSPFRSFDQDYPVPDALFAALRRMESIAGSVDAGDRKFDERGREIIDHPEWRAAYQDFLAARHANYSGMGYEGQLGRVIRHSRATADRSTAFYGAFFGENPDHVINLISHIPGEPHRPIREEALARAIPYLRANLDRRLSDLTEEQRRALITMRREAGELGVGDTIPEDSFVYGLNIKPFAELLVLEDSVDRAQGWWFFKEIVRLRRDEADAWLRPMVGRIRYAVKHGEAIEKRQVFELLSILDPEQRRPPPATAEGEQVVEWSNDVIESVFPPIRVVSRGLVELYPGKDRDALVRVGRDLLQRGALGHPARGQLENGDWYRGVKVAVRPAPLDTLPIPVGSILTHVNSMGFEDEAGLLAVLEKLVDAGNARLMVEFVEDGKPAAVEFRIID